MESVPLIGKILGEKYPLPNFSILYGQMHLSILLPVRSEPLVAMVYRGGRMTGKLADVSVQKQLTCCTGLRVSIQSTEAQGMETQ